MKFSIYGPMDTGGGYRFCVKFSIKQPKRPIGRKFLCGSGHDTMKSKPPRTYLVAGSRGGQMNHGRGIIRVCGRGRGERFGAGMKNPRAERTFAGALRPYAILSGVVTSSVAKTDWAMATVRNSSGFHTSAASLRRRRLKQRTVCGRCARLPSAPSAGWLRPWRRLCPCLP